MNLNQSNTTTLQSEDLADGRLKYYLTQQENCGENYEERSFGVRIECSLFGNTENVEISDITPDFNYAQELFHMIQIYMVTPITLRDIVEDFLVEKYGS